MWKEGNREGRWYSEEYLFHYDDAMYHHAEAIEPVPDCPLEYPTIQYITIE